MGRRSARVDEGRFVVEGAGLLAQAFLAGWQIESVFLAHGTVPESLGLPAGFADAAPRLAELAPKVMERVATTEAPQPVLAVVERRTATIDALDAASLVLVADRIADPGNAGTLLRSAEAAGVDAIVFTSGSVDVFNPKVVRSSAGALFAAPVVVDVDLAAVADRCRRADQAIRLLGTSSHDGAAYDTVDLAGPVALVVGNEAHGLDAAAPVDGWVTIPHSGRAESLNVAMAATVLVFEAARQRARR